MKPKLILCLALVLSGSLFGCKSVFDSRLDDQRQQLTRIYQDKSQPMTERVAAFDNLLETFKAGTPCTVLGKSFDWDVETRIVPDAPFWQVRLQAPDGSDRWMTLKGEFPDDQIIE